MSDVNRYTESCMEGGGVVESKDGELVDYSAYIATQFELIAHRLQLSRCAEQIDAQHDELAALREELATEKEKLEREEIRTIEFSERLAAAEQRNAVCNAEIVAMVESALRRSFSLGQVYWQQADSDSTFQQNKSDQTVEVQAQHILNVIKSINDLTKPTESGASE